MSANDDFMVQWNAMQATLEAERAKEDKARSQQVLQYVVGWTLMLATGIAAFGLWVA